MIAYFFFMIASKIFMIGGIFFMIGYFLSMALLRKSSSFYNFSPFYLQVEVKYSDFWLKYTAKLNFFS